MSETRQLICFLMLVWLVLCVTGVAFDTLMLRLEVEQLLKEDQRDG